MSVRRRRTGYVGGHRHTLWRFRGRAVPLLARRSTAWAAHTSSTAASRTAYPAISCSRRAATGASVTRSSIPSAAAEVVCSSETGAASRRHSAASAVEPWPMTASPSSARSSRARSPLGKSAEARVEQLLDPFVGDRDRLREPEPRVVKPDGDGGDVVVAVREHSFLVNEHGRVVGGGAELGLDQPDRVSERMARGRVGLGDGAEAERILEVSWCDGFHKGVRRRRAVRAAARSWAAIPSCGRSVATAGSSAETFAAKSFKRERGGELESASSAADERTSASAAMPMLNALELISASASRGASFSGRSSARAINSASGPGSDQARGRSPPSGRGPIGRSSRSDGPSGFTPRFSASSRASTTAGRTPAAPSARPCARTSIAARTNEAGAGSPWPTQWAKIISRLNRALVGWRYGDLLLRPDAGGETVHTLPSLKDALDHPARRAHPVVRGRTENDLGVIAGDADDIGDSQPRRRRRRRVQLLEDGGAGSQQGRSNRDGSCSSHAVSSAAGTGWLIKNPWATSQPSSRRRSQTSASSTPSATTSKPRLRPRSMVERTIIASSSELVIFATNERSIFNSLIGSRLRYPSEV